MYPHEIQHDPLNRPITDNSSPERASEFCDCQTAPLLENYSKCLMNSPQCRFALSFGYSYFCRNPQHRDFIR